MKRDLQIYMYLKYGHILWPNSKPEQVIDMLCDRYDLQFDDNEKVRTAEIEFILKKVPPMQLQVQFMHEAWLTHQYVASVLGVSQPTISYHLHSKVKRGYSNPAIRFVTKEYRNNL